MNSYKTFLRLLVLLGLFLVFDQPPELEVAGVLIQQQTEDAQLEWVRQFGGAGRELDIAQAVDAFGNAYVVGITQGTLPGQTSAGDFDAFIRKYDPSGTEVWTRQFGTNLIDFAQGVAVDATGVYVAGRTLGTFPGQERFGSDDAFVRKYDPSGTEVWTRQFGTSTFDQAKSIAVDDTGVYIAGFTFGTLPDQTRVGQFDAFVKKYDAAGTEVWTRQFGSSFFDFAEGVSADLSGIYVVGSTAGELPGQVSSGSDDAFVRKYDAAGTEVWTRQFGTPALDQARGVSANAGSVYVTGSTENILPGQQGPGRGDAFVRKYDAAGTEVWTRQFGTPALDQAYGISANDLGIYVAGLTEGAFPGQVSSGSDDAFVRKYDAAGTEVWTRQFGTPALDQAYGVSTDSTGTYVGGITDGIFPGQTSSGGTDGFLAKLKETVQPSFVLFDVFSAKVEILPGLGTGDDKFELKGSFTLGQASNGIDPIAEEVILRIGSFSTVIPAGSFRFQARPPKSQGKAKPFGEYKFFGTIEGVDLEVKFTPVDSRTFELRAKGIGADFIDLDGPVAVELIVGDDQGSTLSPLNFFEEQDILETEE